MRERYAALPASGDDASRPWWAARPEAPGRTAGAPDVVMALDDGTSVERPATMTSTIGSGRLAVGLLAALIVAKWAVGIPVAVLAIRQG